MRVDPRALAGIERKTTRAAEHLRWLHTDMAAWDAARPWRLVPEVYDGGRKRFYRLALLQPIPIDWAVVLGEVVHDLHSALEQCVYWLTVDWGREALPGTSFPLYTDKGAFYQRTRDGAWNRRSGMWRIRGLGPGPRAFIEDLQPYRQRYRRFYCQDLRTIHDFWNQDKHRLVHLWGLRFDADVRLQPHVLANSEVFIDRRVLQNRAIVLKILSSVPHQEVRLQGGIGASITVFSGKRRAGGGSLSLWHTAGTVVDVIRKLTNAIGHQDDPISLNVWTEKTSHLF